MTKPIDWLLAHFDDSDVSEIVLGLGRPVAVRSSEGFRPVTSMSFARKDIEILVAGTPLSGLIGSPTSQPPVEIDVDARRLVVEVVRQGAESALRISLPARREETAPPRSVKATAAPRKVPSTAPPHTATTTTTPRTPTPTAPPQPDRDAPVRFKSTIAPRTVTAAATATVTRTTPTVPPDSVASAVSTPRTMAPPLEATPTPAPSFGVTMRSTTIAPPLATPLRTTIAPPFEVPRTMTAPPLETPALEDSPSPAIDDAQQEYPAGGEIEEVLDPGYTDDQGAEGVEELGGEWYGPQIVDEHTDISALHALLEAARRRGASDLHVIANQPITIRRLGELVPVGVDALVPPYDGAVLNALSGPLEPTMAENFLLPLLGPSARLKLEELGYVDLGFSVPDHGRVRGNISRQKDGLAGAFRMGRDTVPTLAELGLPPELAKVVRHHQGLVVIAGPSGHGKTTTMAALVDLLNTSNADHIITIEDPVEIEHPPMRAIVSHREVKRHTLNFVGALKASLREDPDVIVIGELRDRETVEIALTAAETGHLVLATISTPSAVKTIDRLIDMFPPDDQVQVRASISGTLRAVIAQRLLPNATRDGMVAAIELVTGVLPLATMIRDNKLFQLPSLMQRGRSFGMIRLDDSLVDHVRAKRITEAVALAAAENRKEVAATLSARASISSPTLAGGLFGPKGKS